MLIQKKICKSIFLGLIAIELLYVIYKKVGNYGNEVSDCDSARFDQNLMHTEQYKQPNLLYILILTAPSHFSNRQSIRSTWLDTAGDYGLIKYSFFIGNIGVPVPIMSEVIKEKDYYGDITILHGVEEVYERLSRKVLQAFSWVAKHIDAVYFLETDDDCYVVMKTLYEIVSSGSLPITKLMFGPIQISAPIQTMGKWAEFGWYLCDAYLPYALGVGYIITQDVVKYIRRNRHMLTHYNNDDLSVGAWVAPLNLTYIIDNERVTLLPNPCTPSTWVIHGCDYELFRKIHSSLQNGKLICS